jgi:hypothetical protein
MDLADSMVHCRSNLVESHTTFCHYSSSGENSFSPLPGHDLDKVNVHGMTQDAVP